MISGTIILLFIVDQKCYKLYNIFVMFIFGNPFFYSLRENAKGKETKVTDVSKRV